MKSFSLFYFYFLLCSLSILISCKTSEKYSISDFEISLDVLKEEIKDAGVYKILITRHQQLDTTLTEKELKILYYGQLAQPDYQPDIHVDLSEIETDIKEKKWDNATLHLDSILRIQPIHLKANYLKTYISHELDSASILTKNRIILLNRLYDAILSTGDGESKKNAIDVVSILDEYFICYQILFTGDITQQAIIIDKTRVYDVFTVKSSKNFTKRKVWFDITHIYPRKDGLF